MRKKLSPEEKAARKVKANERKSAAASARWARVRAEKEAAILPVVILPPYELINPWALPKAHVNMSRHWCIAANFIAQLYKCYRPHGEKVLKGEHKSHDAGYFLKPGDRWMMRMGQPVLHEDGSIMIFPDDQRGIKEMNFYLEEASREVYEMEKTNEAGETDTELQYFDPYSSDGWGSYSPDARWLYINPTHRVTFDTEWHGTTEKPFVVWLYIPGKNGADDLEAVVLTGTVKIPEIKTVYRKGKAVLTKPAPDARGQKPTRYRSLWDAIEKAEELHNERSKNTLWTTAS